MLQSPEELEGIAREVHDALGVERSVDAFVLARALGLSLRPHPRGGAYLENDVVYFPTRVRASRQHFRVAHELGHWLLARAGHDDRDEASADYLGGALMLPREAFLRDLAETDWDLFSLLHRHPNVSAQAIAVRMTQVTPAVASVWDAGRLHRTYGSPHAEDGKLVDRVLENELPIRGDVSAWPVFDGRWRRVLVVRRAA